MCLSRSQSLFPAEIFFFVTKNLGMIVHTTPPPHLKSRGMQDPPPPPIPPLSTPLILNFPHYKRIFDCVSSSADMTFKKKIINFWPRGSVYSLYLKKMVQSENNFSTLWNLFQKYVYLIPYQSGINALSVAF